jgi:hypothetical protein
MIPVWQDIFKIGNKKGENDNDYGKNIYTSSEKVLNMMLYDFKSSTLMTYDSSP